jgi:transcriptional regulator with XRE-family HTH domain
MIMIKLSVRELREQRGWTVRELARKSNVPHSTIHDIEQGNHDTSVSNYVLLCNTFDINPYNELLRQNSKNI